MTSEQALEEMSKGTPGPRITPGRIDDVISDRYFINGWAAVGASAPRMDSLKCLTICIMVLRNGFTVVGTSACASPANYSRDIGERLAEDDAREQVWKLEGYLLRQDLANRGSPLDENGSSLKSW